MGDTTVTMKSTAAVRPVHSLDFYLNLCRRTGRKGRPFNAASLGLNPDSPVLKELVETNKLIPCQTLSSGQMYMLSPNEKAKAQEMHAGKS